MTGTNCDYFTHNQSRSYLNHLVLCGVRCFETDVSRLPIGPIFKGQAVQEEGGELDP